MGDASSARAIVFSVTYPSLHGGPYEVHIAPPGIYKR